MASIALMAAVVSVFEKSSQAIADDRDDLALLNIAEELPDFLANDIPNPVVEGARLDQGWSTAERNDFVEKAKVLAVRLKDALMQTSERTVAFAALQDQFGGRIPDDLTLYVPVHTLAQFSTSYRSHSAAVLIDASAAALPLQR